MIDEPTADPRSAYFDSIAERWDGWEEQPAALAARLAAGLAAFGVGADEFVLDVGCGTGNLTLALLARLSPAGCVAAVDLAPRMIDLARRKAADPRVSWYVAGVGRLPLADGVADRAVCLNVWPHVADREAAADELHRVLRPAGVLHVWHLAGRETVNRIHAGVGGAVGGDVLPPAAETAALLARRGFVVERAVDEPGRYLVTAVRQERA